MPRGRPKRKTPSESGLEVIDLDEDEPIESLRRQDIGYVFQLHRQLLIIDSMMDDLETPRAVYAFANAVRGLETKLFPYWGKMEVKSGKMNMKPDKDDTYWKIRTFLKEIRPKDIKDLIPDDDDRYRLEDYEAESVVEANNLKMTIWRETMRYYALLQLIDKHGMLFQRQISDLIKV